MNADYLRTLRLNDQELDALLDRLDEAAVPIGAKALNRRLHQRYRFRAKGLSARFKGTNEVEHRYLVAARNLSAGGMALVHGDPIDIGSTCFVSLRRIHGTTERVRGMVMSCRQLQEGVFEAGIQFAHLIAPAEFVDTQLGFRQAS